MKELCLLAASGASHNPAPIGALKAHWDAREVPPSEISLPRLVDGNLEQIRARHMQWAYDMAFAQVKKGWAGKLADMLQGGEEPSMWWTSLLYERHPRLSPNLYAIYRLVLLETIIQQNSIGKVTLYGGDKTLAKVVSNLCHAMQIGFDRQATTAGTTRNQGSLLARIYALTPAPLRALARFVHWWLTVRRHLPYAQAKMAAWRREKNLPSRAHLPATITTYFPNIDLNAAAHGRFRSRYWENLHQALNLQAKSENPGGAHFVRWLFIRFPSPQLSFRRCIELRAEFEASGQDGQSFTYLEEMLSCRDIAASWWRWLRIAASSLIYGRHIPKACHFANSKVNFWPYAHAQWVESFRGWRCLERCMQNRAFRAYYAVAGRQRWNLFPLENCPWERMLTRAAHANATGPVYGAQHSIIRPTDFRYFDDPRTFNLPETNKFQPDVIAGNGTSAIEQWLGNGMPAKRAREVEALRYLYLVEHEEKWGTALKDNIPPAPGEPLAPPAARRLLVLTSFFAGETSAHLKLLAEAMNAGLLAGWQITIKPHPCLSINDWLSSLPAAQRKSIRIADGPIALELKPGVCVWASNSTTAALEAALFGLPVMVMLPHEDFDLCPIQNVPGLPRTGSVADVRSCLENMKPLHLPEGYLDLNPDLTAWRKLLNLE